MRSIFNSLILLAVSMPAFAADNGGRIPEPGSLALIGIAAVAGLVMVMNRKGKK